MVMTLKEMLVWQMLRREFGESTHMMRRCS